MMIPGRYIAPMAIVATVSGCALMQSPAIDQTYLAAETYKTIQIVMEAYVTSPVAKPEPKLRVQQLDREMVAALKSMRASAEMNNANMVAFYSNVMAQLLVQVREILVTEGLI